VLDNGIKYNEWKVNQKELDFVESRRFTRDEVFAIFKVPKSIV
jgi:phage portal protein BeeE